MSEDGKYIKRKTKKQIVRCQVSCTGYDLFLTTSRCCLCSMQFVRDVLLLLLLRVLRVLFGHSLLQLLLIYSCTKNYDLLNVCLIGTLLRVNFLFRFSFATLNCVALIGLVRVLSESVRLEFCQIMIFLICSTSNKMSG